MCYYIVKRTFCFLALPLLLSACTGLNNYHASEIKNLTLNTELESVKASMTIYEVDAQCQMSSLGSFRLREGEEHLAIPIGKPLRFVVSFKSFSLFSGSSHTSWQSWLTPNRGQHYAMDVTYRDKIYSVTPYVVDEKTGERHPLNEPPVSSCR